MPLAGTAAGAAAGAGAGKSASAVALGALECRALWVSVPGGPRLATVDVALQPGRLTAILGPNGAGKSTLLSLLSGQSRPLGGQVRLGGQALGHYSAAQLALVRAVMPQENTVAFDFSVQEVVEWGRFAHRSAPSQNEGAIALQALQATGVAHLALRNINTLSGGERARVHLARALAQLWEPRPDGATRWLLLDEPTAALDLSHQHQAMALLRLWAEEQGVGVVAVLHDLNLALRYAHDVLLLEGGRCQFGPVADTLCQDTIARVWQVDCTAVPAQDGVLQYLFA